MDREKRFTAWESREGTLNPSYGWGEQRSRGSINLITIYIPSRQRDL